MEGISQEIKFIVHYNLSYFFIAYILYFSWLHASGDNENLLDDNQKATSDIFEYSDYSEIMPVQILKSIHTIDLMLVHVVK